MRIDWVRDNPNATDEQRRQAFDAIGQQRSNEAERFLSQLESSAAIAGMSDLDRRKAEIQANDLLNDDEKSRAMAAIELGEKNRKAAEQAQQLAAALDDLKTPAQKLDEQIQSFADALAEGKITGDQYDDLVAKARGDFEGDAKLPSLVIAGSAEAQMLRWQGQGQSLEREHLEVAKRTSEGVAGLNRTADRIERALADQESYETTDLPGLA
jgi:hypothetical protein